MGDLGVGGVFGAVNIVGCGILWGLVGNEKVVESIMLVLGKVERNVVG